LCFPIFEARNDDFGVPRVGVVDSFGFVAEGLLSKAFRIATLNSTLGPGIAI
jgi:hypothetical protein